MMERKETVEEKVDEEEGADDGDGEVQEKLGKKIKWKRWCKMRSTFGD